MMAVSAPANVVTKLVKSTPFKVASMARRARRPPSPRTLVWLLVFLATLESLFQAGEAYLDGSDGKLLLWAVAAVLTAALSVALESVKAKGARYR